MSDRLTPLSTVSEIVLTVFPKTKRPRLRRRIVGRSSEQPSPKCCSRSLEVAEEF